MATRVIIGIAALAFSSACGLISAFANLEMVNKVNGKLTEEKQFGMVGWYFSKTQRLHREYRRFFPDGRLLLKVRVLGALMIASLLVCAWSLGFFAK